MATCPNCGRTYADPREAALRAAEAENARLSEENRTFRTNYRSGTSGYLNASDMRNIPDQEDDVSEAQEWEDFDRDC